MRYRVLPEDFRVEEIIRLPRGEGPYTLYLVRKAGRTTLEVQAALAQALHLPPAQVHFPALKDRHAVTSQYAAVHGDGPAEVRGEGWSAHRAGHSPRPLRPGDLRGNRFTAVLRDLAPDEATGIAPRLEGLARAGLPNYFDQQRFGSYSPGQEWVGKHILQGDAVGALRAHLSQPMAGDPEEVLSFKEKARTHWGEWEALFAAAPRPSNFRSVLVFLRDHPQDFRRALNLVTPRVLSLYLAAYQSLLWNRLVGRFLRQPLVAAGQPFAEVEIAGERLPLYTALPADLRARWQDAAIPLPHHRAVFPGECAVLYQEILAAEGLEPASFKARLLRKAYLGQAERALLAFPGNVAALGTAPDERFPGRQQATVRFTLPPGAYATLVLRAMAGEECQGE